MNEQQMAELLQLVDEPGDSTATDEFKQRLRHELDETLYHGEAGRDSVQLVRATPGDTHGAARRRSGLLLAAAAAVAVFAIIGLLTVRDGSELVPADQPAPTTTAFPPTTVVVLPDAGAACDRYTAIAAPIASLAAFGRDPAAPTPDLSVTEAALRQLVVDAAAGRFVSADVLDALELAAGALAEAQREADAGDLASASSSTELAALNLMEISAGIAACFPE